MQSSGPVLAEEQTRTASQRHMSHFNISIENTLRDTVSLGRLARFARKMSTSFITLPDCRRLSYIYSNPTTSPHIVLLSNSLCAPLPSWDKVASRLESDGFGVLRYDQPGHGASDAPADISTTTFASLAKDVRHLLEALRIHRLHAWIGVSMGAATGVYFATASPGVVEKLVICDIVTCSAAVAGVQDVFAPRVEAAQRAGNMDAIVEQTLERWFSRAWRDANVEEVARMRRIMGETEVKGFAACCNALQSPAFDLRPLMAQLGKCVQDALFMVGELDASLPQSMEELRSRAQGGFEGVASDVRVRMQVIKGAGHVCYVDNLEAFCNATIDFLSRNNKIKSKA